MNIVKRHAGKIFLFFLFATLTSFYWIDHLIPDKKEVVSYIVTHKWTEISFEGPLEGEHPYLRLEPIDKSKSLTINLSVSWPTYQDAKVGGKMAFNLKESKRYGGKSEVSVSLLVLTYVLFLLSFLLLMFRHSD